MSGFARLFLRVVVTNLRIAQHRRPVFSSTANTGSHKPTRNFKLTPDKETLIDVLVKSGRYGDASEVVREGCGSSKLARRRTQPDWGRFAPLSMSASPRWNGANTRSSKARRTSSRIRGD